MIGCPNTWDRIARWASPARIACAILMVVGAHVGWRWYLAFHGVDLFSDDAYYYAVIARNLAETGRFTFDGLSSTSGFHPLLLWLEAAGYALLGTQAAPLTQYVVISIAFGLVFLATLGVGVLVTVRRLQAQPQSEVCLAVCMTFFVVMIPRFAGAYLGGMEAILVLPLLLGLGFLVWQRHYALAGVAAMLLVIARLDTLPYVVAPIALACTWREFDKPRVALSSGLSLLLPAAAVTMLLLLWNWWWFGQPMPIHGVLKSCFPQVHLQWEQLSVHTDSGLSLLLAVAAATIGLVLGLRRGSLERNACWAGLTGAILALIQAGAFVLFQKWTKPIPAWYLTTVVLAGGFALAMGIANTVDPRRLPRLAALLGLVVLAINVISLGRAVARGVPQSAEQQASQTPTDGPTSLIDFMETQQGHPLWACTDCGKMAFWSGQRVVNLDGLVNDFHYQGLLRDRQLAAFLRKAGVKYLIFLAWDRRPRDDRLYEPMYEHRIAPEVFSGSYETAEFYVYSYQYLTYSDRVRLPRAAEVWRSAALPDGRAWCKAVVFDVTAALRDNGAAVERLANQASSRPN